MGTRTLLQRRKLTLKAKFQCGSSHLGFKRSHQALSTWSQPGVNLQRPTLQRCARAPPRPGTGGTGVGRVGTSDDVMSVE